MHTNVKKISVACLAVKLNKLSLKDITLDMYASNDLHIHSSLDLKLSGVLNASTPGIKSNQL
jgi:hypothetical protein